MANAESVADINGRKKTSPKLPSIKNLLILLVVAFGVTQDRIQTLVIALIYFVLLSLFA